MSIEQAQVTYVQRQCCNNLHTAQPIANNFFLDKSLYVEYFFTLTLTPQTPFLNGCEEHPPQFVENSVSVAWVDIRESSIK
jgi:hypothetical protein